MEHSITIVKNPEFENLLPDELLEAYDNRSKQIATLRAMWDRLNSEQIEIMIRYYEITDESEQS
jgi:hypothetical protein